MVSPTGLYEYDALYRLIKAQGRELTNLTMASESDFVNTLSVPNAGSNAMQNYTQMFSYDELGNLQTMQSQGRWSRSYIYDNVTNRLLRHEGTNNVYTYDAHGNMTSMPHLSSMTWNSSDMLRSAGNGTFSSYYSYNAAGDRVRKVVEKGNIREERLYLGNYERYRKYVNNILKTERQTVHIIDDRHRFALIDRLTIDNGITLSTATNSIRYQYDNHLGSASLELDQTAAIISYEEYHPFGTTSYRSGRTETEVSQKRYKYVGKERDEETGLYYYGARYYAAWLGRWISVDPKWEKYLNQSVFVFCANNPISNVDMDGCEWDKTNKTADIVKSFREEMYKLRTKINEKISTMKEGLQKNDEKSEKYSKTLTGLSILDSKLKELKDAEDELNYMEAKPNVVFSLEWIKEDPSKETYLPTNGERLRKKIESDTTSIENGKVVMRYNRGDFDSLSHELKHGYQFIKESNPKYL